MSNGDLSQLSMLDLFRMEAESQTQVLTAGLLTLERNPTAADALEACMRAAHSLKGAARIVGVPAGVDVAHVMEDGFVAAQKGSLTLRQRHIDQLLRGVDMLMRIATTAEADLGQWAVAKKPEVDEFLAALAQVIASADDAPIAENKTSSESVPTTAEVQSFQSAEPQTDRVLRVTADNLNRLLGLASESLVESRWLKPFADSLLRLKRLHHHSALALDNLREKLSTQSLSEPAQIALAEAQRGVLKCHQVMSQRLGELEMFDRRVTHLSHRLYDEALACRMRPFADGVQAFPRMVRDVGRSLGKQVRLEIIGEATQVDRDILQKLDAPLGHLLRNAVDHGVGTPAERRQAGKLDEGVIQLDARHSAGVLQITVADDGRGIDLDKLRATIVERKLTNAEIAAKLSEAELLEFLFLPGFTMKEVVTDISGRGVGLDVVQDMVKGVRGAIRVSSELGKGTRFQLQLPLTLSVIRALLVEIGGESYALPLAYIVRTLTLSKDKIQSLEGRQHFNFDGRQIGLVSAHQILEGGELRITGDELPVIVVGDHGNAYGLVVDRFLGSRELVVQPLDPRLGKIKDISAGALMEDGSPVLIIDVDDVIRSVDKLAADSHLGKVDQGASKAAAKPRKRVLVVDDSLTVRELERKLLGSRGYDVEIAVDGMDGWNAVRTGRFDLIVTDVDMPRLNGIELVTLIKKDPHLKSLPVMVVSYKDREEDRNRGLAAGADYYLTKGSFHDETLLQAVVDLIGDADA
ncbi:MAG: hybrid sensor histidine kinase/response regulator [Gammaproteobacteria bacterium]|nr:hybrid sensor histidine kinase/response regulator [Gammaproteobacteria bacterium]